MRSLGSLRYRQRTAKKLCDGLLKVSGAIRGFEHAGIQRWLATEQ